MAQIFSRLRKLNKDKAMLSISHNWEILLRLTELNPCVPLSFSKYSDNKFGFTYRLYEELNDLKFEMHRSIFNNQRDTRQDSLGLIGFSGLDLKDKRIILTEGVSDYISAKLWFPKNNVLGLTNLGGTQLARTILISIGEEFLLIGDNDAQAETNTGLTNVLKLSKFLDSHNLKNTIALPDTGFNDLTDQFIFMVKQQIFTEQTES